MVPEIRTCSQSKNPSLKGKYLLIVFISKFKSDKKENFQAKFPYFPEHTYHTVNAAPILQSRSNKHKTLCGATWIPRRAIISDQW